MKTRYRNLALVAIVITSLFLLFSVDLPALFDKPTDKQIIKQGLSIAMAINATSPTTALHEGQNAQVQFTIQDAANKQPIKGLHPSVWLERENPQEKAVSCKERINSYLQSQLAFKPEIDFNAYFVLTLNNNPSISVIDPLNGFGGSKLITQIRLHSPAVDWVLSKDNKRLYVATPETREVAVVDTQNWQVITFLPFETTPTRLALQPDGKYLWVGLDNVRVVDTEKNTIAATLATGAGHHEFAFSDDSRTVYVSNPSDKTLALIDIEHLSIKHTVNSTTPIVALAFSALSKSVYAATESGSLLAIDASGQITADINTGAPLKTARFNANGRWGFALSQSDNKVFIIDASLNRLTQMLEVGAEPDQISFTDNFVYIRSTANETINMLDLTALNNNKTTSVTSFPAGQVAPNQSNLLITDAIVPTPERNAVVVANPSDKTVYYYTEGMTAPMGNFENLGLKPMAVMIVNRSMQETAQGVYTGITQLPAAGNYNVSILLDKPPVYHCFTTTVAPNPKLAKQNPPIAVAYLLNKQEVPEVPVGVSLPIKIKLNNVTQDNINDLQVLIVRIPAQWQQRILAKPLGNNLYQVDMTPPEAGLYQVFTQSPTLNFSFNQQSTLTFRAIKSDKVND